jgi:hypothetical protein
MPTPDDDDVSVWLRDQAELLRRKRFAELDLDRLVAEFGRRWTNARRVAIEPVLRLAKLRLMPKYDEGDSAPASGPTGHAPEGTDSQVPRRSACKPPNPATC